MKQKPFGDDEFWDDIRLILQDPVFADEIGINVGDRIQKFNAQIRPLPYSLYLRIMKWLEDQT